MTNHNGVFTSFLAVLFLSTAPKRIAITKNAAELSSAAEILAVVRPDQAASWRST